MPRCIKVTYRSHPGLSTIIKALRCCLCARALRLYEMLSTLSSSAKGVDSVDVSIWRIIILWLLVLWAMIRVIILVLDICIVVCWLPHIIVLLILIIVTFILSLNLYLGCIYFSEEPLLPNINLILGLCSCHTWGVCVINRSFERQLTMALLVAVLASIASRCLFSCLYIVKEWNWVSGTCSSQTRHRLQKLLLIIDNHLLIVFVLLLLLLWISGSLLTVLVQI